MLKITPYIPFIIPIIIIGSFFNPLFGYFLLFDMILLMLISPFKGRYFCGNLCSRGNGSDIYLRKISRKIKIPKIFKNFYLRIGVFVMMMGFMGFRVIQSQGLLYKLGAVFATMYLMQTIVISIIGITTNPRAWCHICPAGTIQKSFDQEKYLLKADKKKCIDCGKCNDVCPMELPVKEIINQPDCIKCGRCIDECPKKVLSF